MQLRFGYKFLTFLLLLIALCWLTLIFIFSNPREMELKGLSKSMIEWFTSSSNTKISLGSAKLVIDSENFLDRLVLKDVVLIRNDVSDSFGNISEIQVRFNARSLIQRFYTPIDFIFSDAEIFMVKGSFGECFYFCEWFI